jgi:hypothetical protein
MGDAGEVLVDAEDRLQERLAEREQEQRRSGLRERDLDPVRVRERTSLQLGRAELSRQLESTSHPVRREQIAKAIADIDQRLSAL